MRRFISVAVFGLLAGPALAEPISLNDLSAYLNGISTARADFTQINDDGTISTGTLSIRRPGRMRFEYNPPDSAMVLASAGSVVVKDPKSNQPPEVYPLKRTPLSLILARKVDLGRANMVTQVYEDGAATVVTAQDPEHPEQGSIDLRFTADPVELRQWVIDDGAGTRTTVILGDMERGLKLPHALFAHDRGGESDNDD